MTPDIIFWLIAGAYAFTSLNWAFTFWVYLQAANHLKSRIEKLEKVIQTLSTKLQSLDTQYIEAGSAGVR